MAPSSLSSHSSSNNAAALTGFALGSAVTLLGVWLASKASTSSSNNNNSRRRNDSRSNHKSSSSSSSANSTTPVNLPPEIRDEQLSRHTLYFGKDGMETLKNASIVVVGVGGVGSHIAHMVGTRIALLYYGTGRLFWFLTKICASGILYDFSIMIIFLIHPHNTPLILARARWSGTHSVD